MSGAALPPRRGAHRARRSPLAALLPSLLAVGAVLALVGILYAVLGSPPARTSNAADGQPGGPSAAGAPAATTPAPSATPAATTAAPSTAGSTAASTQPSSPAAVPTGDRSPSSEPTDSPSTSPSSSPDAPVAPRVVVLNETRRTGLAAETASRLRARGWRVERVGNFRGNVGETTVYYPRGAEQAARALAADLVGVDRVRPVFPGIAPDRLTVVLAPSYAG